MNQPRASYFNRKSFFKGFSLLTLCLAILALDTTSAEPPKISNLTPLDQRHIQKQKSVVEEIAKSLGQSFRRNVDHDIALLQRLLDTKNIAHNMTKELQAMGFVLGDLLAAELDMHWVIYEDSLGRSRALRYKDSDNFLFPVTMISRRREVHNLTSVREIYDKAFNIINLLRDPLPFKGSTQS